VVAGFDGTDELAGMLTDVSLVPAAGVVVVFIVELASYSSGGGLSVLSPPCWPCSVSLRVCSF
jgi:hypothetical protein